MITAVFPVDFTSSFGMETSNQTFEGIEHLIYMICICYGSSNSFKDI